MHKINILVAGCTGRLGSLVVAYLIKKEYVNVRCYARNLSKVPKSLMRNSQNIEWMEGSANDESKIIESCKDIDVIICCYAGDNDFLLQSHRILIKAAIISNVKRFIPSDYSFDFRGLKFNEHPAKNAITIIHKELMQSNLQYVFIQVGCFMQTFWGYFGVWNPTMTEFIYWGDGNERMFLTTYENCAQYIAEVSCDFDVNGFVQFAGDYLSINEIASLYKYIKGIEPKLTQLGTLKDLFKYMHKEKKHYGLNQPKKYMNLFYQYYDLNGQTKLTNISNNMYPYIHSTSMNNFLRNSDVTNKIAVEFPN